jgi:predicted alpha-1,2-mannosidase
MQLSKAYEKLYDPHTGFIRPKDNKGVFQSADGFKPNIQTRSYTEGNPWQYLFLVPHDIHGLCRVMGGKAQLEVKLDSLFATDSDLGDDYAIDISGLIGQYAHGNEPSHHIAYMYNYIGKPWKGAQRLREIMGTMYGDDHMGLPGNEDEGQMSAWYVLSALGIYQVEPCGGRYNLGSPIINEATLDVSGGKTFKIVAHNNSVKNIYVQKVKLNGKPWSKSYIDYSDIVKGGTLEFFMGAKPSKFGTKTEDTAFGDFNPGAAK